MANLIAVQQAIKEVDAKKIISFHTRIRLAEEFAKKEQRGIAYHLRDYEIRHVNGGQSSEERGEIIRSFASAPRALLTNARCLTEGINIPAVDMVAFIDPRQSKVDITQAVGRAMRKPRGPTTKTVGYIVVPVFAGMGEEDTLEDAIKCEKFEAVVDVLNALQEHDEELVDILREIRVRKGAGEASNPRRLNEKVEVIGPRVDLDRLTTSIEVEIADRIGSSWDESFGLLLRFRAREGHCRVRDSHVEETANLGRWVGHQRANSDNLSPERRRRLDEIGFVWDPLEEAWEEGFAALTKFKARQGHCHVPKLHIEGMFKLRQWRGVQRQNRDTMPAGRKYRLDAIGFVWDSRESGWEEGFAALTTFKTRKGHCRVPRGFVEDTFMLGGWVSEQRHKKDTMSAERRQRLDAIGFIWDPHESTWEEGFAALTTFKAREGHCNVNNLHIEGTFKLGQWVSLQRSNNHAMSTDRRQRLDAIAFIWDPLEEAWEEGFAALTTFKAREGHCRVPKPHIEDMLKLGQWVDRQRTSKDEISPERRQRFDEIGFVWDPHEEAWEEGFAALTTFKTHENHCRVPQRHIEGAFKLGAWVAWQRATKDKISSERRQRLDEIGFVWDPHEEAWEEGFAVLTTFKAREGHCRVPDGHVETTCNLGKWIGRRRAVRDTMPAERRQRLDEIGFVWDPLEEAWREGFAALTTFKTREGHCRVPQRHVEGAFKLGAWVSKQRGKRNNMFAELRQRLDEIGFVWRVK
jgi:Helicase associated domain/Helicase conserved C-terminal domain